MTEAAAALARIAERKAVFASRDDDSGTHKRELDLWRAAGLDPRAESGTWYRETGSGMGATLNTAAAMDAYVLTDRATWLQFRNKQSLALLGRGRSPPLQPLRGDPGRPGAPPPRQGEGRPDLHRLARLRRRPARHRRLPDRRRAGVRAERGASGGVGEHCRDQLVGVRRPNRLTHSDERSRCHLGAVSLGRGVTWAVRSLGVLGFPDAPDLLRPALNDPAAEVRRSGGPRSARTDGVVGPVRYGLKTGCTRAPHRSPFRRNGGPWRRVPCERAR